MDIDLSASPSSELPESEDVHLNEKIQNFNKFYIHLKDAVVVKIDIRIFYFSECSGNLCTIIAANNEIWEKKAASAIKKVLDFFKLESENIQKEMIQKNIKNESFDKTMVRFEELKNYRPKVETNNKVSLEPSPSSKEQSEGYMENKQEVSENCACCPCCSIL